MQRNTVRQKDASETEGACLQTDDRASRCVWGRNVGYNDTTRKKWIEVNEMGMLR